MKSYTEAEPTKLSVSSKRLVISICGIAVNALISYIMYKFGFLLYFDTLGTIGVAVITGSLLPAIFTAVFSSILCAFFYWPAIYLSFFNSLIAIITIVFVKRKAFKKLWKIILYTLIVTLISSLSTTFLQYALYGREAFGIIAKNAGDFASATDMPYLLSLMLTSLLFYFLEKGFICLFVMVLLTVLPKSILYAFENDTWQRRIISDTVLQYINNNQNDIRHPLRRKFALTFIISSTILVVMTIVIALRLYFDGEKIKRTNSAWRCVETAASVIDPLRIDDYLKYGKEAQNYQETLKLLSMIRKSSNDVTYLYVLKIEKNGGRFIFDTDDEEPYQPGELVPFDKEFEPYLPDLFEGKTIEPVESNNFFGWLRTVYYPVYDSNKNCVCYVGADVSMQYLAEYFASLIAKVVLIISGFFLMIIAYTVWTIGNDMAYPISAMAACIDCFSDSTENLDNLDKNVRRIRSLDIQSGDEIQKLYDAICRMTLSQSEQIRDIQRLSDSTLKMQDGLIVTMADMVENRDSDTGAHVQKTAAYVKIIVEGLKKKGYYPQKISPKFMSDVVRSAPLHDVGKINISDSVLNKPGKLTDEEFAIMKTHTTAGKEILEKVISTVQGESYLKEARNMAAYHHERWDGRGYPEGLHGEVIPLSARIMAVADVFDALASPRVYKPAFPLEKALAILQEGSGSQFDPKCVEVFLEALPEVKMILKKYSSGENMPAGNAAY